MNHRRRIFGTDLNSSNFGVAAETQRDLLERHPIQREISEEGYKETDSVTSEEWFIYGLKKLDD